MVSNFFLIELFKKLLMGVWGIERDSVETCWQLLCSCRNTNLFFFFLLSHHRSAVLGAGQNVQVPPVRPCAGRWDALLSGVQGHLWQGYCGRDGSCSGGHLLQKLLRVRHALSPWVCAYLAILSECHFRTGGNGFPISELFENENNCVQVDCPLGAAPLSARSVDGPLNPVEWTLLTATSYCIYWHPLPPLLSSLKQISIASFCLFFHPLQCHLPKL